MVKFVEVVVDIGFGSTRKEIKAIVENMAREKQVIRKEKITDGWFRRFLERQLAYGKVIILQLLE